MTDLPEWVTEAERLEADIGLDGSASGTPYMQFVRLMSQHAPDALALIREQQAEIERLTARSRFDTELADRTLERAEAAEAETERIKNFWAGVHKDESASLKDAEAALERVRELHRESNLTKLGFHPACDACNYAYPCPTIKALDGDL